MLAAPKQPDIFLAASEAGIGFSVTIVPPPNGPGHDRDFQSYIEGRTFARSLRWATGWKLIDRVEPRIRKAAEKAEQRRIETRRSKLSIRA